jgi:hypothetical protein
MEKAHSLPPAGGSRESVVTDFRYLVREVANPESGDLEKEALRRMDYTLLPFLTALFLLSFLVSERDAFYFGIELDTCVVMQDRASSGKSTTTITKRIFS